MRDTPSAPREATPPTDAADDEALVPPAEWEALTALEAAVIGMVVRHPKPQEECQVIVREALAAVDAARAAHQETPQ